MTLEQLLGPFALTIGLLAAVAALWRDHLRADADDRRQRDVSIEGWRASDAALNRLAAAIEKDSADRVGRRRNDDDR